MKRVRPTGDLYHRVIPDGAVYVGRGTRWGNPYKINGYHDRRSVLDQYRDYLHRHPEIVDAARRELSGRDLACWCKPDEACHADILIAKINAPAGARCACGRLWSSPFHSDCQQCRGVEDTRTLREPRGGVLKTRAGRSYVEWTDALRGAYKTFPARDAASGVAQRRECGTCHRWLPPSAFGKNAKGRDSKHSQCYWCKCPCDAGCVCRSASVPAEMVSKVRPGAPIVNGWAGAPWELPVKKTCPPHVSRNERPGWGHWPGDCMEDYEALLAQQAGHAEIATGHEHEGAFCQAYAEYDAGVALLAAWEEIRRLERERLAEESAQVAEEKRRAAEQGVQWEDKRTPEQLTRITGVGMGVEVFCPRGCKPHGGAPASLDVMAEEARDEETGTRYDYADPTADRALANVEQFDPATYEAVARGLPDEVRRALFLTGYARRMRGLAPGWRERGDAIRRQGFDPEELRARMVAAADRWSRDGTIPGPRDLGLKEWRISTESPARSLRNRDVF